jgi:hypothetical protein
MQHPNPALDQPIQEASIFLSELEICVVFLKNLLLLYSSDHSESMVDHDFLELKVELYD